MGEPFRDPLSAARERVDTLEREVAAARRRLEGDDVAADPVATSANARRALDRPTGTAGVLLVSAAVACAIVLGVMGFDRLMGRGGAGGAELGAAAHAPCTGTQPECGHCGCIPQMALCVGGQWQCPPPPTSCAPPMYGESSTDH